MALFHPFRKKLRSRAIISLPNLIHFFMARRIGLDYEDSVHLPIIFWYSFSALTYLLITQVELARASVDLFRSVEGAFESSVRSGSWPCDLPPSIYSEYFTWPGWVGEHANSMPRSSSPLSRLVTCHLPSIIIAGLAFTYSFNYCRSWYRCCAVLILVLLVCIPISRPVSASHHTSM